MPFEKLISDVFRYIVTPTLATDFTNIFKLKTGPNYVWSFKPNRVKHRRGEIQVGSLSYCRTERTIHTSANNQGVFLMVALKT